MSLRTKFVISNILMLVTPIILVGVISIFFVIFFIRLFPEDAFAISQFGFTDVAQLTKYLGAFFARQPFGAVYAAVWAVSCVVSTALTVTYITARLSDSIIPPIRALTEAAERIKGGELDFEMFGASDAELNRLCDMFDEMRRQLKYSKRREQELRHERSMILANLSHDIKMPVTAIKGYVSGIRDGLAANPEALERYLGTIYQKADTIEKMIDSLSIFSKLEMDKIQFSYTIGDIYSYVRNVAEDFMLDAQRADCNINIDLPDGKCYVKIDYEMLYRVFANLIDNSIKYRADENAQIRISAAERDDGVLISVTDNGIGMADEELEKVFDGFYRIDTARSKSGSGLGLGISRQIVENHGGRMWFKGGLKKGSEAIIYLPKRINE